MRVPGRGTDWLSRHRCPMGNGPAFLGGPLRPYLWGVEARAKGFVREDVDQSEEGAVRDPAPAVRTARSHRGAAFFQGAAPRRSFAWLPLRARVGAQAGARLHELL
jgi:hypothetical protein